MARASRLLRSGAVSARALNSTLAKTRAQNSRMANFDSKSKDDGKGSRGISGATSRSIDTNQRKGSAIGGAMTKGSSVGGSTRTPTSRSINENAGKKWPSEAGLTKADKTTTSHNTRMKGR